MAPDVKSPARKANQRIWVLRIVAVRVELLFNNNETKQTNRQPNRQTNGGQAGKAERTPERGLHHPSDQMAK